MSTVEPVLMPYLGSIQVVRLHVGWFVSLRLLGEGNGRADEAEGERVKTLEKQD